MFKRALCIPPDPSSSSRLRRSKLASSCSEGWLRPWEIDDSYQTQPEIAHGNVMCVRVLCWNIQWNNIRSYCWIAAICRALWNEIRKESYNNTTGWRTTLIESSSSRFGAKVSQEWRHTDLCLNLLLAVPFMFCIFGGFGALMSRHLNPVSR